MKLFNRMNGWQRLWFVLTCLAFVGFGVVYPYLFINQINLAELDYRQRLIRDLDSPLCRDYAIRPFSQLTEPPFDVEGGGCYVLYLSRQFNDKSGIQPYTLAAYDAYKAAYKREQFFWGVALIGGLVLVVSALVYFLGFLVAWIRRGILPTCEW